MKKDDDLESALLAAKEPAPAPAKGYAYALTCALLASLTSIIYGYNRGVMSGAQKFVQADLGVTDAQLEVLIGATSVYSLVGTAVNRVMSAIVGMTFIPMYEAVGMAGTFYIFAPVLRRRHGRRCRDVPDTEYTDASCPRKEQARDDMKLSGVQCSKVRQGLVYL
ncbi:Carbohydrate transporter/ sugar porter [Zea mays]|uniref:Carbohydrate transporter/ sugar porter n=1 Tax=Zea mays TaxID=4577 RepID=A0A1D6IWX1_MAIZE|nr:Carbohydrate transporter/ sugar porter [Zea mays]